MSYEVTDSFDSQGEENVNGTQKWPYLALCGMTVIKTFLRSSLSTRVELDQSL